MTGTTLGEVLIPRESTEWVGNPGNETFVTVRMRGLGAVPRSIGEGKTPRPFRGSRVAAGDLIYSRIDARNGAFAMVPDSLGGAVVSKDFPTFGLRADRVEASYLSHLVRAPAFWARFQAMSFGATNRQRIDERLLLAQRVYLPPLPEQRRIAAILDEADALRAACNAPIARAAVLREHTARSSIGEAIEVGARHMRLGDLVKFSNGRFLPAKSQRAGEVTVYGGNGPSGRHDEAMFTSPQLVVGRVGALCGAVHVTEGRVWVTDNALIASWDSNLISIEHLAWQLRLANLNQYAAVSGQPSISAARIGDVPVVLPSAQEARHFAGLEAETQELIARLGSREKLLTALFASLQHRAFRGEL